MSSFNEPCVLVGIDGTECAKIAAEWAADEAQRRKLPLRLVNAYTSPTDLYPFPGVLTPEVANAAKNWAQHMLLAASHQLLELHPDLTVHTALRYGHPVEVLKQQSQTAVLTVVGSHGSSQFADALLGSVASRVATHAAGPVVVIRTHPTVPVRNLSGPVVVGVDDTPHDQVALGFAFEEASMRGTGLIAVHSWDDQPLYRAAAWVPLDLSLSEINADETRLLNDQLAGWSDKYPGVPLETRVVTGKPAESLLHISAPPGDDDPAQLLVVGSRGRSGIPGLLLGSTSAAVIAHAQCPVAVVRDRSAVVA